MGLDESQEPHPGMRSLDSKLFPGMAASVSLVSCSVRWDVSIHLFSLRERSRGRNGKERVKPTGQVTKTTQACYTKRARLKSHLALRLINM